MMMQSVKWMGGGNGLPEWLVNSEQVYQEWIQPLFGYVSVLRASSRFFWCIFRIFHLEYGLISILSPSQNLGNGILMKRGEFLRVSMVSQEELLSHKLIEDHICIEVLDWYWR
jgi:hypothetical protein